MKQLGDAPDKYFPCAALMFLSGFKDPPPQSQDVGGGKRCFSGTVAFRPLGQQTSVRTNLEVENH